VFVLMTVLVPQLAATFKTLVPKLPRETEFLVALSAFFVRWWYLLLGVPFVIVAVSFVLSRTDERTRRFFDNLSLKLPLLGAIRQKIILARFSTFFAMLYRAGISVLDTPGHAPGHLSFEVAGGDGLIIATDTIIHPVIYFAHPEWKFGFDSIHEQAVASRKSLLDRAATDKVKLLGYHWTYPGVGYAERKGPGYVFVPSS
jgi:glyoxylase-like metal-dependent hydrolase (beta-lactamase superfamily II)